MAALAQTRPAARNVRRFVARRVSRHPERYVEIMRVLRKYQLYEVVAQLRQVAGDAEAHPLLYDGLVNPGEPAENLASALEELGPCFIKLGQLLSTRPDLLPPDYISALARLQKTIRPVPSAEIVAIVERELGAPLDELFAEFDRVPLATASMAQAHRATLLDGTPVVIKVQRPGVRQRIVADLGVLNEVAQLATKYTKLGRRYGLVQMVRELEQSLLQELDFAQEGDNTRRIGRQIGGFTLLTTPTVFPRHTTERVLTLSYVCGRHLADVPTTQLAQLDSKAIARDLLSAYLKQIVVDGIFHCDPHPGNILLTERGQLALLDFGMVGRLDAGQKDHVILLLLAFAERQGERVAETYLALTEEPQGFDRRAFTQDVCALVSRYHDMSGGWMALGSALLDLGRLANTTARRCRHRADAARQDNAQSRRRDPRPLARTRSGGTDPGLHARRDAEARDDQLSPARSFAWVLDMKHLFENARAHRTDPRQSSPAANSPCASASTPKPAPRLTARRLGYPRAGAQRDPGWGGNGTECGAAAEE
ncbi:MAG: AarF/UbiB family protein [Chloroflexia bacterium]